MKKREPKDARTAGADARGSAGAGLSARQRTALRRALLAWFDRERRPLPWRIRPTAYGTVVSEFMLQQTQVAAVIPYFERFLARWPTFEALARAREDEVLAEWTGLGYYRRAGLLRAACAEIAGRHRGKLPRDAEALAALPGFGPYTAAAVGSIALGLPMAAIDGNVRRVLARIFRIGPRGEARRLRAASEEMLDPLRPGAWNEAMMELGARICLPTAPKCAQCPVARWCGAFRSGDAERFPEKKKAPATKRVREVAVAAVREGKILLLRRPAGGPLAGMWELPKLDSRDPGAEAPSPEAALRLGAGLRARGYRKVGATRGVFTHHRIEAELYAALGPFAAVRRPASRREARWTPLAEAAALPMSAHHRRMLALAAERAEIRRRSRCLLP